ncbi:CapA family protein [Terrisporobacter sp.]
MSRKRKHKKRRKKYKNFLKLCLVIFLITLGFFSFKIINNKNNEQSKSDNSKIISVFNQNDKKIETYNASILAAGDVMVHSPQLKAQFDSLTGTYNFENNFKYVKKYVKEADYSLANLETTLAGNDVYQYSSYPMFNSPDELADSLKNTGFDLLSTINNHSFDKGDLGVSRTLSTLKGKGFDTVGTRIKESDKDYFIKNINNIKVGFTSYSYGDIKNNTKYLNGIQISKESEDKMNIFDSSSVDNAYNTISSTVNKMKDADIQIVILHWGIEYTRDEISFQDQLAKKLCDNGVDIIIGSHPHVVEPVKTIKSSDGKNECVVVYSLGNYISNQRRETVGAYSEDGLMVNFDITKKSNENKASVKKVTCIPTWVNKYNNGFKDVYEIIPIENKDDLDSIANLNKLKVEQSYKNTSSLINTSDIVKVVSSPFK